MTRKFVSTLVLAIFAFAYANSARALEVVKIEHSCGSITVLSDLRKLAKEEVSSLRNIFSFLYDGGGVVVHYFGAPKPTLNRETERQILEREKGEFRYDYILSNLKSKGVPNPTRKDLENELSHLILNDPAGWYIHKGPAASEVRRSLTRPVFSRRAGQNVIKLIEDRINGKTGGRKKIMDSLKMKFGLVVIDNIEGDENCHVGDTLGPD